MGQLTEDDGYDGVQHDTFWAPDPAQIEAEQIRRDCAAEQGSTA